MKGGAVRAGSVAQQPVDPIELLILGATWIVVAISWAALLVVTPLLAILLDPDRGLLIQVLLLQLAPLVPASFAVAGMVRLRDAFRLFAEPEPVRPLVARTLPLPVRPKLGDGRPAPEIAVGRFGAAFFRQLPSDVSVRRYGDRFEFHIDGEWVPFDEPVRQDGHELRALRVVPGDEDGEFVAKVYAAIVTTAGSADEKPGCAILRPDQILPFLAGMPLASMELRRARDPVSALIA